MRSRLLRQRGAADEDRRGPVELLRVRGHQWFHAGSEAPALSGADADDVSWPAWSLFPAGSHRLGASGGLPLRGSLAPSPGGWQFSHAGGTAHALVPLHAWAGPFWLTLAFRYGSAAPGQSPAAGRLRLTVFRYQLSPMAWRHLRLRVRQLARPGRHPSKESA